MICLRPYQDDLIRRVYQAMKQGRRRVIAALATGGGKSVIGAKVGQDCADKGARLLWLVHRRELVMQAVDHLVNAGLDPALIMAGEKPDPAKPVQVASIQTLVRRKPPPADLIEYDEVHHSASKSAIKVLEMFPDAFWLGLTATACRLDGKGLGSAGWQEIVTGPDTRWLIENGYLADYEYWAPATPDMKGVKISGGDFAKGQAAERMGAVVGDAVKWYEQYLDGRQAIVFCASVEQSQRVDGKFSDRGIWSAHADAKTDANERADTMQAFREGDLKVLSNVQLVDEGFDVPECDGAIIARPTRSLVFHRQSCGRALRPKADGGRAVIIDMAGNAGRLGLPCEPIEWSLDGKVSGDSVAPIRTCPSCFGVCAAGYRTCPYCGKDFPVERRSRTPRQVDGLLMRLEPGSADHESRLKEIYQGALQRAVERGWKLAAAKVAFQQATGKWPTRHLAWVRMMEDGAKGTCRHQRVEEGTCRFCGKPVASQRLLWRDRDLGV